MAGVHPPAAGGGATAPGDPAAAAAPRTGHAAGESFSLLSAAHSPSGFLAVSQILSSNSSRINAAVMSLFFHSIVGTLSDIKPFNVVTHIRYTHARSTDSPFPFPAEMWELWIRGDSLTARRGSGILSASLYFLGLRLLRMFTRPFQRRRRLVMSSAVRKRGFPPSSSLADVPEDFV